MRRLSWLLLPFALLGATPDWMQFRGPNGAGVSPSKNLPDRFDSKSLLWRTPLPPGHSSPVLTSTRIFVTAFEGKTLLTICLDRAAGRVLWRREAPRDREESFQPTNGPASPSPVTDGTNVYVFFGDFGLISYSADGDVRWRLPLGPFNNANGHGSSPILADGKLVLICDQDTDSYLLAVDPASGRVLWKTPRPEYTRGYATPAIYRPKTGPAELIVPGSFEVASYALETGQKLWWVRGMAWQLKSVPVIDRDRIFVSGWEIGGDQEQRNKVPEFAKTLADYDRDRDGKLSPQELPRDLPFDWGENDLNQDGFIDEREWRFHQTRNSAENCVVAIRAGGQGDVTRSRVLWRYRKAVPNTSSPLLYQGVLYLLRDGILTSLNPETGEVYKQARLTGALGSYWASPVAAADGRILLASEEGKLLWLRADPQWEIQSISKLDEDTFATPAILDDHIYVRTEAALYDFAKKTSR
jgi:outer membrane protein assembly factor BamB